MLSKSVFFVLFVYSGWIFIWQRTYCAYWYGYCITSIFTRELVSVFDLMRVEKFCRHSSLSPGFGGNFHFFWDFPRRLSWWFGGYIMSHWFKLSVSMPFEEMCFWFFTWVCILSTNENTHFPPLAAVQPNPRRYVAMKNLGNNLKKSWEEEVHFATIIHQ